MEQEEADAIAALATGALNVFLQTPLAGFLSIGALVLSFVIALLITRRLKRVRPITSRIRIVIDYLSTLVLTILIMFAFMRTFSGTLANPLVFVLGGLLLSFLVVRLIGMVVELIFKPHDPLRSILRVSSVLFWLTLLIYLFGQWNPTVKGFFDAEYTIGDAKISVFAILTILFFAAIIVIVTIWLSGHRAWSWFSETCRQLYQRAYPAV
jgi:hypothetical protein